MEIVKYGVLGVSNHFKKRCLLPGLELENAEIEAVASRSYDKAYELTEKYGIPKAYASYESLLEDTDIDAVFIPLPNHMHLEWIKKSADAGKHILCEKPLTMNAKEASEAHDYCKERGVLLMEAFMYKFHPQWERVKDIIDSGEMGKIQAIHTFFAYNNPNPNNIRNIKEYGGGAIMDIGCYGVSTARYLLGKEPEKVVSLIERHPEFGTDMLTSVILDFGKPRALFTVGTALHPYQRFQVFLDAGRVEIDIPFNTYPDVEVSAFVTNNIGTREIKFGPSDQYGLQFEVFAYMVMFSDDSGASIDAVKNMKVIDALFKSEKSGSWEKV